MTTLFGDPLEFDIVELDDVSSDDVLKLNVVCIRISTKSYHSKEVRVHFYLHRDVVKEINPNFSDKCNIGYDYNFLAQKVGQELILRESDECHLGIFEQN